MESVRPIDYRLLFEGVPGAFLVVLPDSPTFTIVAGSEAYFRATLTRREEITGKGIFDVFPDNPNDPAATGVSNLRDSLEQVVASRLPNAMAVQKYDIPRPDGDGFEERFWSPLNTPILDADGRVVFILHRVDDVTDFIRLKQRDLEQSKAVETLKSRTGEMEVEVFRRAQEVQDANRKLREMNEKLDKLDQLKTQFFANVSHELRTPLALIIGPSHQLLSSSSLSASERGQLEVVERNARLLLKHVNDLLDVSKLEAGKMKPEYAEVDLRELVLLATSYFEVLAKERSILFVVEAPESLRAQVDPGKLQRVLVNLLSNAFKFTPAGGRVRCTLRSDAESGRVVLEVADSGPGIPPELRATVFERFQQLEGGSTRRFGGTGLGLAIAKDFVELHRGEISVSEAPEGGALFRVVVPTLAPADVEVREARAARSVPNDVAEATVEALRARSEVAPAVVSDGRPLVLVVEDNSEMNRFLRDCLQDYSVASAFDGKEGLEKALQLHPDLILTDIMMPGMSGDELVRAVRRDPSFDVTPIIVLTAKADDDLRIRLLQEGAQDYVMKPFAAGELRARVGNLISIKRARGVLQRELETSQDDLAVLATEMKARKQRVSFLAEASRLLGASLDLKITLQRLAQLVVPTLADFCLVDLLLEDHRIERVATAHADPEKEKLLIEVQQRFPPDWDSPQPTARVLHTGRSELLTDVTPTIIEEHTFSAPHAFLLQRVGVRSHMAVPLIARGRVLGVLHFGSSSDARHYVAEDLTLAEDLAARAALAIENARLYREANEAIRTRDEFLSIASHELRTPLTPLKLQISDLQRRTEALAAGTTPRQWIETRLEKIARQGSRLEHLVNQLLDVTRITAGRLTLDLGPVDLAGVVRDIIQRLTDSGELERAGSTVNPVLPESVIGRWDQLRIEQVVENLLSNAIKYGNGKPISVIVAASESSAVLIVQDQGIGLSQADQRRVFDKFERAVSARHYGGLGMGLFIVRQIVEALGGSIHVESEPGHGATFTVRLPRTGPAQTVTSARTQASAAELESPPQTRH